MNRMEFFHSLSNKRPTLCMKFMVSIGANPITLIVDDKQLPVVANGCPLSGGIGI